MTLANAAASHKAAPFIPEDPTTHIQDVKPTDAQLAALNNNWNSLDVKASTFVFGAKAELRYVASRGMWMYWDEYVWKWDTTGRAQELVKDFGRSHSYPVGGESDDQKKSRIAWYKTLTSPKGISDLLSLAKTDPMMTATPEQFDAGTTELNTPAGVVSLRTGEITPPNSAKLVKRSTSVAPDASCKTVRYENLLSEAFFGHPELSDYFEAMMGITLLKGQQEQVFMYMFGKAGSGKGTLMNIAKDILGAGESGYTAYVDADMFVSSRMKQHPTEMMQFLGARMVISSEITQGQKMDTGKLKRTTGGDSITGRYMGKDYVTFDPTHTLWLMANDRLQVPHDDAGVWRRLRVLPFNFSKNENEQEGGLFERIMAEEAPGILARWIAKAGVYLTEGLSTPSIVLDARDEYVSEQDTLQQWLDMCADDSDGSAFTSGSALRDSYNAWSKAERITPLGIKKFTQALNDKGFSSTKKRIKDSVQSVATKEMRGFQGIALINSATVYAN